MLASRIAVLIQVADILPPIELHANVPGKQSDREQAFHPLIYPLKWPPHLGNGLG